ncbi:helix-turn-helix domain-containing protein [Rhodococcus hoagii]|nr:helix-turn-helix domain-containing protein [Prescottella equi]
MGPTKYAQQSQARSGPSAAGEESARAELRERAGFSRATLGRIEAGERDVEIAELMAIASVLGVTAAELLQAVQDSLEGKQL